MAKRSETPAPPERRTIPPRFVALGVGVMLGAAWGAVMWLIFELAGRDSGGRGLLYLILTMAMIGGGVAAFFGATSARRQGERVTPKLPYRRRGSDKR